MPSMNFSRLILIACTFTTWMALAQPAPPGLPASRELPPMPPLGKSPVLFFRELLAMPAGSRLDALTNRSVVAQSNILAKITEYEAMPPDIRETRLRATHLRWLLLPLLRMTPGARRLEIGRLDDADKQFVRERLARWDQLSPSVQGEFLEHEATINYLIRISPRTSKPMVVELPPAPPGALKDMETGLARWSTLGSGDRDRMIDRFQDFFDLAPKAQTRTLNELTATERAQLEQLVRRFGSLDAEQRRRCLDAFQKIAQMTHEERAVFFKNAERWQAMSQEDRQAWRNVVRRAPDMPPLPPGMIVPGTPTRSAPATAVK